MSNCSIKRGFASTLIDEYINRVGALLSRIPVGLRRVKLREIHRRRNADALHIGAPLVARRDTALRRINEELNG